jgi:hypothetical protein
MEGTGWIDGLAALILGKDPPATAGWEAEGIPQPVWTYGENILYDCKESSPDSTVVQPVT